MRPGWHIEKVVTCRFGGGLNLGEGGRVTFKSTDVRKRLQTSIDYRMTEGICARALVLPLLSLSFTHFTTPHCLSPPASFRHLWRQKEGALAGRQELHQHGDHMYVGREKGALEEKDSE